MANPNPRQTYNPVINSFYRAYLGFEVDSTASVGSIQDSPMYEQWYGEIELPKIEFEHIKIGVGDRSFSQYNFVGRIKAGDAEVKLKTWHSKNVEWLNAKMNNLANSRTDMRRLQLIVFGYDEQLKQKIGGWKFCSGLPKEYMVGTSFKWDGNEAAGYEINLVFERAYNIDNAVSLATTKGNIPDITDLPMLYVEKEDTAKEQHGKYERYDNLNITSAAGF